jgi:hypothetical protein
MTTETELRKWTDAQLVDALVKQDQLKHGYLVREVLHQRMISLGVGSLYEYIQETSGGGKKPNGGTTEWSRPSDVGNLTDRELLDAIVTVVAENPGIIDIMPNQKLQEACDTASYQYADCVGEFLSPKAKNLYRWCLRELRMRLSK